MIGELPPFQRDGLGGHDFAKHRIFHGRCRQACQVRCGGIVLRIVQSMGIDEVGITQSQLLRLLVHQHCEVLHAAGAVDSQGRGGVVAGVEHHPIEQGPDLIDVSCLQVQAGALHVHRLRRNLHRRVQTAKLTHQKAGHNFGGAGDQCALVAVLRPEDTPCVSVQQDGALRRYGRRRRGRAADEKDGGDPEGRRATNYIFHIHSPRLVCPAGGNATDFLYDCTDFIRLRRRPFSFSGAKRPGQ